MALSIPKISLPQVFVPSLYHLQKTPALVRFPYLDDLLPATNHSMPEALKTGHLLHQLS
jgi:hypothetical protein